jgi:hypothetical protein
MAAQYIFREATDRLAMADIEHSSSPLLHALRPLTIVDLAKPETK